MSTKYDLKHYLYIYSHISEYFEKDTFLFSWVLIITQRLISQSWNKAVSVSLFPNQGIETHWHSEAKPQGNLGCPCIIFVGFKK